MRLFGTSGIRALFDESLVYLALKAGLAVGKVNDNVVVGSDTRTSSDVLKHALISGLLAAGSRCDDVGVVPTPTLAFATRKFNAGVMITASHNPPQYNGIKLLNPDGSAFDSNQQEQIEGMVLSNSLSVAPWREIRASSIYNRAVEKHVERILQDFPGESKLKVVLDCGCGAASVIAPNLLRKLGCEVVALNCYPSGFFPHAIEPTEANLRGLILATKELGADLGIAHDGDADRMMAVDDNGRFIPGDKLLVLFAQQVGAKEVVTTIDASMVIDEIGFTVTRTPVGDTYVSEELKKGGDFGESGCVAWLFDSRGVITIENNDLDTEELALQAIDAGAEDVNIADASTEIYTKPEELETVRAALEQGNIPIASAELSMVPKTTLELEEKAALQTLKLLHKFEELDEVQQVSSNVDFSDAVLEQYQEKI